MHRSYLMLVTALTEGGTGLLLLVWPLVLLRLLLGVDQASTEALATARIAGAALLAIGVACWLGRNDHARPAQQGLLLGILIYDVGASAILVYTGWFSSLAGIALWPAVVLHAALTLWCAVALWKPS
jgi:hypothetical protein